MGLEASSFISGLTPSWPISGDPKSQGDDHIRLIKSVLQSTFPNASKALYFPSCPILTAGTTLTAAHQNATVFLSTTTIAYTIGLPALAAGDAGWTVRMLKYTTDANYVHVVPPSGVIYCQAGSVNLVRIGQVCKPATFVWTGSAWFCTKDDGPIGETICFDGATVLPGYLVLDGTTFDNSTFTELYLALGTNVLRDKRGRVDAGVDTATGRLSNAMTGVNGLGGTGGLDYHYLTAAQIPGHYHGISLVTGTDYPDHTHGYTAPGGNVHQDGTQSATVYFPPTNTQTGGASARHQHNVNGNTDNGPTLGSSWHPNVQPTIITQKLIRAC